MSTVVKASVELDSRADHSAYSERLLAAALEEIGRRRAAPQATYRLQLHAGFRFLDALAIVPYLADLGISDCYASPYLKAAPAARTAMTSPITACSTPRSARPMSIPPG